MQLHAVDNNSFCSSLFSSHLSLADEIKGKEEQIKENLKRKMVRKRKKSGRHERNSYWKATKRMHQNRIGINSDRAVGTLGTH